MLKKSREEYFNEFMTKSVFTTWFVHVFGLENITDNDSYNCNHHWNVCKHRKCAMFNKLKMALHKDLLKEECDRMSTSMMRSMQNLDGLWEAIYYHLPLFFKSVVKMSYITAKKTVANEIKRGIGKDYAEQSKELL